MSKSLYSVMLMDEVVREIDRLALAQNTNRSNLINQILAEYVSYTTPEMRINDIFRTIEAMIGEANADLIPFVAPHQSTMQVKSSLAYRYRPTIKYDVELFRNEQNGQIGKLSVLYRTQSQTLAEEMTRFFRLWALIEKRLRPQAELTYALGDGRFIRGIGFPEGKNVTSGQAADAIASYISLLDKALKAYLAGEANEEILCQRLKEHLNKEEIWI